MDKVTAGAMLIAIGALLLTSAGLRADADAGGDRGRAHIEKTCMRCHDGAKLDALVRARVGDRELPAALDAFLAGHYAADPALRADVLVALEQRLAAAGE